MHQLPGRCPGSYIGPGLQALMFMRADICHVMLENKRVVVDQALVASL